MLHPAVCSANYRSQRAIEIVQRAIEEDKANNYDEAYKLYSNALDYFMLALKCTRLSSAGARVRR